MTERLRQLLRKHLGIGYMPRFPTQRFAEALVARSKRRIPGEATMMTAINFRRATFIYEHKPEQVPQHSDLFGEEQTPV